MFRVLVVCAKIALLLFRSIDLNACRTCFSHADTRTADSVAILSKSDSVRQEYFKLKSQLNQAKAPRKEPNLLEKVGTACGSNKAV